MLLRNQKGTLIKIDRKDFVNDEEYYAVIYKIVSGKDWKGKVLKSLEPTSLNLILKI